MVEISITKIYGDTLLEEILLPGFSIKCFETMFSKVFLNMLSNMFLLIYLGFPGEAVVKNLLTMQLMRVQYLSQEDPQSRKWQSTPVFLSEKSHRQRSLVGYNPWGNREPDTT